MAFLRQAVDRLFCDNTKPVKHKLIEVIKILKKFVKILIKLRFNKNIRGAIFRSHQTEKINGLNILFL